MLILTETETACLTDIASRDGLFVVRGAVGEVSRKRLIGKLLRDGLIAIAAGNDGEAHCLTVAGYHAIGLHPPRTRPNAPVAEPATPKAPSKRERVLALLSRVEGAALAELIEATGWLPHTTRAALSRLRSAGRALAKSKREDGTTAYRIMTEEPAPAAKGKGRRSATKVTEESATA